MAYWLFSRLLSYCTLFELIDYLAEFLVRRTVSARAYITPSQYVDLVDSSFDAGILIVYEILLLSVLLGLFILGFKSFGKKQYRFSDAVWVYGKALLQLGLAGLVSRMATGLAIVCFHIDKFYTYGAMAVSCGRDVVYLLMGTVLAIGGKRYAAHREYDGNGSRPRKWRPVLFACLLSVSVLANILLASGYVSASCQLGNRQEQMQAAEIEILGLEESVEELNQQIFEQKRRYSSLSYEKLELEEIVDFFDSHVALIVGNGTKYHTYGCEVFRDADSFTAYDVAAAESKGYRPCSKCH